ncbi:MAG TPA: ATP-dependent RNA helicase RhlB, partial [Xanthomonadaceae bacterium]|nr:ATP-dependent RNA helicase RhlB [Xanthomonadaceae bacterium]
VSLHACEVCVLDEADRMFDLGFIKDIRFLLRRMPVRTERQTLLFSATLSHRVLELAYEHMNEPEKLVVETETITQARVRQKLYYPADDEKMPLLLGLLSRSEGARTMVFVNTKVYVERVARSLERAGYRVGVLSGDVPQKKRESLLKKFQAGQLEILVATDVAARGLHIDGVSHVYNYDLPFDAEDYVHRIGRTARLGAEGDAISFACERYAIGLPDIEAFIEQKIPSEPVTQELMTAQPRKPREGVEVQAEEGESIGEIFREAREQRAADDARRGGGRRGAGAGGAGGRGHAERAGSGEPRRERRPRRAAGTAEEAPATANGAGTTAPSASTPAAGPARNTAPASPVAEGERPARKRRRRRRGQRIEGAETAPREQQHGGGAKPKGTDAEKPRRPTQHKPARRPEGAATEPPSLLSRIGRGLKSLVTRAPRNQH